MRYFAAENLKEYFTVCSYTCYEIIRPEVVMELAWRFGFHDFAMPFFIQLVRDMTFKVEVVQKKNEEREKKEVEKAEKESTQQLNPMIDESMMGGGMASPFPMLMSGGTGMDTMGGMGMGGMPGMGMDTMGGMPGMGMGGMPGMGGMGIGGGMGGSGPGF